ncbi:MAG: hypothetical protein ACLR4Z_05815 [Butyricicoccaceae bacterium]
MTLEEFLVDYASEDTRRVGIELIDRELHKIPNEKVRTLQLSTSATSARPTAAISASEEG